LPDACILRLSKIIQTPLEVLMIYEGSRTRTVNNRLLPDTQLIEFVCGDTRAVHDVGDATGSRRKNDDD
jgi:hypothetical protein